MRLLSLHRAAPPGYASVDSARGEWALGLEWLLLAISTTLAVDQLFVVQPTLYLHEHTGSAAGLLRWLTFGVALAGWLTHPLPGALAWLLASFGLAASGPLHFWAFARGPSLSVVSALPALLAAYALGNGLRSRQFSERNQQELRRALALFLHPFAAVTLIVGLGVSVIVANTLGPVRASLIVGGGLSLVALMTVTDSGFAQRLPSSLATSYASILSLLVYAYAAYAARTAIPLGRVLTSSHPIVYFARSERCTFEVTSGQGAYHAFVDGELRFSTFDEQRWAESLVRPALARVAAPRRALVLSTGEGLIERELLADRGITSITSVVRCRQVPDLAKRSGWLRTLTADAMNSPRVALVVQDPAVYIAHDGGDPFDVVIADLPDPASPQLSKYYSRFFYERLRARMNATAVLVVQATSARRSPCTYATIGRTLEAAGFALRPAMVPLISRGEWSLYFASQGPLPSVLRSEWERDSLAARTPLQFWNAWPDTRPPAGFVALPSTLHDATVLDWFERESAAMGDTAMGTR